MAFDPRERAAPDVTVPGMDISTPFAPGEHFSAAAADQLGLSSRYLAAAVAEGTLIRPRRGWYHVPYDGPDHRIAVLGATRAAAARGPSGAIASHRTAAVLHGLPLLGRNRKKPLPVHLTVDRDYGGRRTPNLVVHPSPGSSRDPVEVSGVLATDVSRTIADLSRAEGFDAGVCAADHALRLEMISKADLLNEVELHRGRTGVAVLRRVAEFADGLAESPGESLSRCVISRFPEFGSPRLQHEFRDGHGGFVARTDFDWDARVVGEFDGKTKYSGRARPGEDIGEVVWREKRREDSIRALGPIVVRWIWADLWTPYRLRRILHQVFRLAGCPLEPVRAC